MPYADLILTNANILLPDADKLAHATIAIRDGRILRIGPHNGIPTAAEILDMHGRSILPGLVDAHIHLLNYAHSFLKVDCEVDSYDECLERVRKKCQETAPAEWVRGHGWNQNSWGVFGTVADLDAFSPNNPIYLTAKSLHAAWVNSKALQIAGIDSSTPDPEGGAIQRDSQGNPTGILFESAMQLVKSHLPPHTHEENLSAMKTAQAKLIAFGLTGVHDFDRADCFRALQDLHAAGELRMRVVKNLLADYLPAAAELGLRSGFGDNWLRLGNIKIFTDGALGPHTAAMMQPYEGEGDNRGILLYESEELTEIGVQAAMAGFGLTIHAIGDLANHMTLDSIEALRAEEQKRSLPHRRHRIEHLQLLHPDDILRPSKLGVIASMQPIHATSDMLAADQFWGERSRTSYAWQSVEAAGTVLAFGSDAPVESPNPFQGIHAAVTRRRIDGSPSPEGWIPEQRISLSSAIRAYSLGAAYAAGLENRFGQLAPGFNADLIVLDEDPFAIDAQALHSIQPVATMIAGQWEFRGF